MSEIGLPKAQLDTPALWTDLDCLERNIARLAQHFTGAGIQWRPHTKGIKTPAIVHKLLAAGAIGVTCAKVGEAEVMVASGVQDILIANQIVTPSKITRLVNLQPHASVKAAVDNADVIRLTGAIAHQKGVEVGLVIELNTGMDRAGVLPGEPTLAMARLIQETAGVRLAGLMTWEGHALSLEEEAKRKEIERCIQLLTDTADRCRQAGFPVEIVSAGGSGTYQVTPFLPGVTETQAGGAIFCDLTYQSWGIDLEPALFVQSTVTSRPTATRIICDAGFKTLPRGFETPKALGLDGVTSAVFSAEHGIITLDQPNDSLKVGDTLDFMVGYGDGTVFLHDVIYGIRKGVVETAWPVLGRGKLR